MGDNFSEIHFGFCLFQQFLLINLIGFSFIVSVSLAKLTWKEIYTIIFNCKPKTSGVDWQNFNFALLQSPFFLKCFTAQKCRNERNVLYEGSRDLNGRKHINQFNNITQTVKKAMYLKDVEELLKFRATSPWAPGYCHIIQILWNVSTHAHTDLCTCAVHSRSEELEQSRKKTWERDNLSTQRRFLRLQKSFPFRAFAYVWTEKVTDKSIYVFERSNVNIASPWKAIGLFQGPFHS